VNPQPFGKYTLLAHIATGGMAEVTLARTRGAGGIDQLAVIKRLIEPLAEDQRYVDMFLDEAKIAARLSHQNIVHVLELGQQDGRYFIAMEFLAGLNVSALKKKATEHLGGVPQDLTATLIAQACAGLHYAHERRLPDGRPLDVVHRDVSPQNLVITYEGLLKLVDFGIAKAAGRTTNTDAGMIKGKFAYLSPEQCRHERIDRRSDLFSLGIVMWELLTAKRLFRRRAHYASYRAILEDEIPRPSDVKDGLDAAYERIVMRALERDRQRRYATAEEMHSDLEDQLHRRAAMGVATVLTRRDVAAFLEQNLGEQIRRQRRFLEQLARGEVTGPAPVAEAYPPLDADSDPEEQAPTRMFERFNRDTAVDANPPAPVELPAPRMSEAPSNLPPTQSVTVVPAPTSGWPWVVLVAAIVLGVAVVWFVGGS